MSQKIRLSRLIGGLLMMVVSTAHAELIIDVTGGAEGGIPIAVVPFVIANGTAPAELSDVIQDNLGRSGLFSPFPVADMPQRPGNAEEINFEAWRALGVTNVIGGNIVPQADGQFQVSTYAFDVFKRNAGKRFITQFSVKAHQFRGLAHHISDLFYEAVTGYKGIFQTRILFVKTAVEDKQKWYELIVADADGFNPTTIFRDTEPLMSPTWSPDGKMVAFVTFAAGSPQIYVQNIATGKRDVVANYPGTNGAPSWSADGRYLAMSLSKDGNLEIYSWDLYEGKLTRLTRSSGIDTEPNWSADGRHIVFTSDRGGKPQIYRMNADGSQVKRVTFKGNYNARPRYSPDGKSLTFIHNKGDGYQIAVMDVESHALTILSNGPNDESPSFAPNGRMILFAGKQGRRGILYAVSVDGREQYPVSVSGSDIREPAWSPYIQ